jgi:hypothetical protein
LILYYLAPGLCHEGLKGVMGEPSCDNSFFRSIASLFGLLTYIPYLLVYFFIYVPLGLDAMQNWQIYVALPLFYFLFGALMGKVIGKIKSKKKK